MYGGGLNVKLTRDCKAIQIPGGETTALEQGHEVYITQVLGGMFTVETEWGYLVRIDGQDADALGQEIPSERQKPDWSQFKTLEDAAWSQLKTCYDPEIPVDIWELGLIYEININATNDIKVTMTLTSPSCPVAETLPPDVEKKLAAIDTANSAKIEITFEPPWEKSMMSEVAMLELGMM